MSDLKVFVRIALFVCLREGLGKMDDVEIEQSVNKLNINFVRQI